MLKRIISGLSLVLLVAVCFAASSITATILVAVFAMISCVEVNNAFKNLSYKPIVALPIIFIAVMSLFIHLKVNMIYYAAVIGIMIITPFVICMKDKKRSARDVFATYGEIVYPALPFVAIINICSLPSPDWIIFFCVGFVSSVGCDTFAYFGGKFFGKHKLIPSISPNKTIEGAISGTVVTTAVAAGFYMLGKDYVDFSMAEVLVTVFICTIISQIGDLAASFVKREAGLKDFGSFIPGHGGALDRLDSVLFAFPSAYIILMLLQQF